MIKGRTSSTKESDKMERALNDCRDMFRKGELRIESNPEVFCEGGRRDLETGEEKRFGRDFSALT